MARNFYKALVTGMALGVAGILGYGAICQIENYYSVKELERSVDELSEKLQKFSNGVDQVKERLAPLPQEDSSRSSGSSDLGSFVDD